MRRKVLTLCLTVPAILLGMVLLVSVLASADLVQVSKRHIVRAKHDLERFLEYRDVEPVSPVALGLTTAITPTQSVWDMLGQIDRDRALTDLRRLTGEEPLCVTSGCYTLTHRFTGSEELGWAMDYLYENLLSLDYTLEFHDWSRSGYTDRNLIVWKTGILTPTEELYLVAHVDGVRSNLEDSFPAADDNGSSVVNLMELARIFSGRSFARTIVFFFSTGEEVGTLGSRAYLDGLTESELNTIKYVINADMTGYDANGDGVMNLAHGDHAPTVALAQVLSETIDAYQLNLDQRVVAGCP
jgi:hypothetical protein